MIDARGVMYIANRGFDRIHRVGIDGVLETIAGDGTLSFLGCTRHTCRDQMGDGRPALDAPIPLPLHVLLTPQNDLLVPMSPPGAFWVGGVFSFLRRICGVGDLVPTAVAAIGENVPTPGATPSSVRLWPNPSNASVTVAFELDRTASVSVRVYDELGQRVRVLAAEARRPAGSYQFVWDGLDQAGRSQASGTYFLVVSVDGTAESHKLTLLH
ncbi:MAG: T9SS type A sorting domain-containing protein [Gemmatimonadaceae bacterium]|nr:T9SS type A sorting domain-containing protein [Gemmatimonadaceae bacterium]